MRLFLLQILLVVTPLLQTCRMPSMRGEPTLELPINEIIPDDWRPLGSPQNISIDGDLDQERLLFFNYDNAPGTLGSAGRGPVGAIIYDILYDSSFVTGDQSSELYPVPNQPSSYYIPYRILPNYWEPAIGRTTLTSADTHQAIAQYIAPPGTELAAIQVDIAIRESEEQSADASAEPNVSELIIRGGTSQITVVWWKNEFDGYGTVQLHGPYGFMAEERSLDGTGPIESVVGSFPENDRSRFCRRIQYIREPSPQDDGRADSPPAIHYRAIDRGLFFCDAAPAHPFYPEGVVLAYLRDPATHGELLRLTENSSIGKEVFNQFVQINENERINEIYTRVALPHMSHRPIQGEQNLGRVPSGDGEAWQTHVCVELVTQATGGGEIAQSRQLRLRLQHEPPRRYPNDAERKGDPDRWYISDLLPQPYDQLSCRAYIQHRPPGSN